ncbi:uncharacterized protein K452DRAFT_359737 [Aplosporella prunicola CBS 121167]|uniref:DUF4604 domain-containing protein n=1 Tax=Aplosporella prunicola CBS 121167 TaxID=1176127 RepID=A0A6A6B9K7_9PEZI|nr:uncharacterized protein K452DRAFT_359737 [Aplosporella prunicola CBS 121167]KAF2140716.1 hypothetical protein K452DRAFT_359737 [Aplosporella prunicola CBS 121167]
MAFNAKNLNYEKKEPAFLRRIKGNLSEGRDPDRQEYSIARPKKAKQDDEDDAPTYVVEESNDTLTKAEYEALVNGKSTPDAANGEEKKDSENPENDEAAKADSKTTKSKQPTASIGAASKKRKAVKVGGDADDEEEEELSKKKPQPKKAKKKAKAVKLSFADEE